jgi:hypothetical protein
VGIFLVKHLPPAPTGGTFAPVPEHKKETAAKDPMQRPVDELGKQAWQWPSEPSQRPTVEVPARPVPEPETERPLLNVSQKEDAMRVQQRLIELNYLEGVADGIWGPRSRLALMAFRSVRGLGSDDTWDYATQEGLFDRSARKLAFVGAWTDEAGQCDPSFQLKITPRYAENDDGDRCEFQQVQEQRDGSWNIRARCVVSGETRPASVTLTRVGSQLMWKSEKGQTKYYACSTR